MQELTGPQNVVVGITAGCIQCVLDHPLITLKNFAQQNLPLSFNPRVLYRGTVADLIGMSSLTAIQFLGTGAIKDLMLRHKTELSSNEMLLSALGGGMLSGMMCSPWELVMIQQQRFGGNLWNNMYRIWSQSALCWTRGIVPSMSREGIFTVGYLAMTPMLESYSDERSGMGNKFACAMVSGLVATALSNPVDCIKSCMQGDIESKKYKGTFHTLRVLYAEKGIKRLYQGATFRFGTMVMAFFVFNRVMEFIAPKMYRHQFEQYRRNNM